MSLTGPQMLSPRGQTYSAGFDDDQKENVSYLEEEIAGKSRKQLMTCAAEDGVKLGLLFNRAKTMDRAE